jgi:hypothetical protein
VTGPRGGDSPLSGVNADAATVAACSAAVQAAMATNAEQQQQAGQWFSAGFPEDLQAHEPGPANAPNI